MITLDSPIAAVLGERARGRKKSKAEAVEEKLGLRTVEDLLRHFPRRYLATDELTVLSDLEVGQHVQVVGVISHCKVASYQDRRTKRLAYRVDATVATEGPSLRMSFFAKNKGAADWRARKLTPGARGVFLGQTKQFRDTWQLQNPRVLLFDRSGGEDPDAVEDPAAAAVLDALGGLFPVYPATAGVESWDLQRAVAFALSIIDDYPDVLPEQVRREHRLLDIGTAFRRVHQPEGHDEVGAGLRRFRFEEALVTQLVLARRRAGLRAEGARVRDGGDGALLKEFDARLPFELTEGQRTVGEEIVADLVQPHPMNRLLQGEVGSGKTLVALRAMLHVVDSGGQAVLLAPTEVLAQQHHASITGMLGDLAGGGMLGGAEHSTRVALLTGSMTRSQRKEALLEIASGEAGIVIGTHALLEDNVTFADLGLVVVDEQHRFGVEQRSALTAKTGDAATPPHVLVMTATPIPRTVAMTVFGDLEISTLRQLPAGRASIQSNVVPLAEQPHWVERVWQRVREEVAKGHQVYVVCPRIGGDEAEPDTMEPAPADPDEDAGTTGETERRPLAAVEEVAPQLAEGPLADVRVGVLHGRLPAEEKDRVMRDFNAGEVDVLVSTTVIEVGVDVPNATAMVILDADRFGVSQLHQLRGRVGRGGLPGLCLLVSHAEGTAKERLDAVAATSDGFALSEVDLEHRREGDVLGAAQSGRASGLRTLRVLRDEETILAARDTGATLLEQDASLEAWPPLHAAVVELEHAQESAFLEKS